MEETGIAMTTISDLFIEGDEACFVACCDADATAIVGTDPELVGATQMIVDVAWFHLADKLHDLQVSKVLRSLNPSSSR